MNVQQTKSCAGWLNPGTALFFDLVVRDTVFGREVWNWNECDRIGSVAEVSSMSPGFR